MKKSFINIISLKKTTKQKENWGKKKENSSSYNRNIKKGKASTNKIRNKIHNKSFKWKNRLFQKIKRRLSNIKIRENVSVLNLEKYNPNQYTMKFGEKGDKFYIILTGKVALY